MNGGIIVSVGLWMCWTTLLVFLNIGCGYGQESYKRQVTLMGSRFEITVAEADSLHAAGYINAVIKEVERIENLISEWRPETQVSVINRNAGIRPVQVDAELFALTKRAIGYSEMTDGAFDVSIAALDRLWRFDGTMDEMPAEEAIGKSVETVGYRNIILDSVNMTIYLALPGMKIGFGSIGKGYAADKGRELLRMMGVQGGIVNASGDLSAWGTQPNGKPWMIGVSHPIRHHHIIKKFKINTLAVATSGSYEKYAEINGVRYSHIIDPRTGYPSRGLASVTIYGASAEFANALSTSVMVMGKEAGLQLIENFPSYGYLIVTDEGRVVKRH